MDKETDAIEFEKAFNQRVRNEDKAHCERCSKTFTQWKEKLMKDFREGKL